MYTYFHSHDGYSRRHETRLVEQDGTPAPAMLITRYTYRYTWQTRGVAGPRGGRARKQRAKYVFYWQGCFYRGHMVATEDGRRLNTYEVFDGWITDAYAISSRRQGVPVVSIELVEGIPVSVTDEAGTEVWQWGDPIADLEAMLQIPEQDRAPEQRATTYDATEQAEQLDQMVDAGEFGTDAYDAACDAYDELTGQISAAIVQTTTAAGAAQRRPTIGHDHTQHDHDEPPARWAAPLLATKRTTNQSRNGVPNMETIAITAIMAILAACTAAGLVGSDNDAMEARR